MRWSLIVAGVAMLFLGPLGLFAALCYAEEGESPWIVPLFCASLGAPFLGLGLVVAGLIFKWLR